MSEYVKNNRTSYHNIGEEYESHVLKYFRNTHPVSKYVRNTRMPYIEIRKEYEEYEKEHEKNTENPHSCIREVYELRIYKYAGIRNSVFWSPHTRDTKSIF